MCRLVVRLSVGEGCSAIALTFEVTRVTECANSSLTIEYFDMNETIEKFI